MGRHSPCRTRNFFTAPLQVLRGEGTKERWEKERKKERKKEEGRSYETFSGSSSGRATLTAARHTVWRRMRPPRVLLDMKGKGSGQKLKVVRFPTAPSERIGASSPSVMGNPTSYFLPLHSLSPSPSFRARARALPSAVGCIAARNSSVATVESVTNPLLGILGRLPPFVAASVDMEAGEREGAQLILVDIIVIAMISEARPPQSNAATSSFRHHFSLSLFPLPQSFSLLRSPRFLDFPSSFRLALTGPPDRARRALHPPSDRA